jgi:uncharacterized protein (DUF1778 family)
MPRTQPRDHAISMRLPPADVAVIDRAAKMRGRSRSEFMREAAVREAETTIMDSMLIQMSAAGFKSFVDMLDQPAAVNDQLLETLQKSKKWTNP